MLQSHCCRLSAVETMSRGYSLDDVVTEFLLKTCRLRPQQTEAAAHGAMYCGLIHTVKRLDEDTEEGVENIALTTGSVAEFYIEPMLPHVGDVDIMFHFNTDLAIPHGHPPPTQLPDEFHNYVQVYEIIDSHSPGYVYLPLRYLLTQCNDDVYYNAVEYHSGLYAANISRLPRAVTDDIHGPALCAKTQSMPLLSVDSVRCIRCLFWPTQAADWPTRHRNYGWPDSATLDRVVSNGCDVVGVAHRQCRQYGWKGKLQHRLSFSRAEIVLINSWMPVQQIVYHLLR